MGQLTSAARKMQILSLCDHYTSNLNCKDKLKQGAVLYVWAEFVMGLVCVGRLCYGPSLEWAEFAIGRDIQLPPTNKGAVAHILFQLWTELLPVHRRHFVIDKKITKLYKLFNKGKKLLSES